MKKRITFLLSIFCMLAISCGDTKKEEKELEETLDKIEVVEQEIDATSEELKKKADEVEAALNELDNL